MKHISATRLCNPFCPSSHVNGSHSEMSICWCAEQIFNDCIAAAIGCAVGHTSCCTLYECEVALPTTHVSCKLYVPPPSDIHCSFVSQAVDWTMITINGVHTPAFHKNKFKSLTSFMWRSASWVGNCVQPFAPRLISIKCIYAHTHGGVIMQL